LPYPTVNPRGARSNMTLDNAAVSLTWDLRCYQIVTWVRPNWPEPYYQIGSLLDREQDYSNAEKEYQNAIWRAEDNVQVLNNIAYEELKNGTPQPARKLLEDIYHRIKERDPCTESGYNKQAFYSIYKNLAWARYQCDYKPRENWTRAQFEDALDAATNAISQCFNRPAGHCLKAAILLHSPIDRESTIRRDELSEECQRGLFFYHMAKDAGDDGCHWKEYVDPEWIKDISSVIKEDTHDVARRHD